MNDLMSLGIHRLWKDHFVRTLNPGSPTHPLRILDIAGGTGDIAFRLLDHATDLNHDLKTEVIVSDINPHMLAVGRRRARESRYGEGGRLQFLEANAEDLKSAGIADNSIDLYTLAFGIRNFTSPLPALREAYRVLKPGGVFACLEFSHIPTSKSVPHYLLNKAYKIWSFGAIPLIGQLVAGDRASYSYLVESIERFPRQEEFAGMLRDVGFVLPKGWEKGREGEGEGWEDLSGGIVAVHRGIKPLG
ncbi:MAG: 2-hexaprenyl-6-methoxy-1,4-benzoquinone methyltransferase [Geoglossum umbratile]|nr:MAG: 2-hexaprenyl-6-methoxy-1,4-benzoquinone methyltransferase [Geoglossum umbratile]